MSSASGLTGPKPLLRLPNRYVKRNVLNQESIGVIVHDNEPRCIPNATTASPYEPSVFGSTEICLTELPRDGELDYVTRLVPARLSGLMTSLLLG
jgi:hypothetical protein